MEFTADETETIKALIDDWGLEYCMSADPDKVAALARRLGIKPPYPCADFLEESKPDKAAAAASVGAPPPSRP